MLLLLLWYFSKSYTQQQFSVLHFLKDNVTSLNLLWYILFLKPDLLFFSFTYHIPWQMVYFSVCEPKKKKKVFLRNPLRQTLLCRLAHDRYKQLKTSCQRKKILDLFPNNNCLFTSLVFPVLFLKICCMCKRAAHSINFFLKLNVSQPYQKMFSKTPCKLLGFQFKCVCTIYLLLRNYWNKFLE